MNVSLTPEIERKIDERLATGLYGSSSELVREALRLFFSYDDARHGELARLNHAIGEGLAALDRGEGVPGGEARRRSHARLIPSKAAARRSEKKSQG